MGLDFMYPNRFETIPPAHHVPLFIICFHVYILPSTFSSTSSIRADLHISQSLIFLLPPLPVSLIDTGVEDFFIRIKSREIKERENIG